MTAAATITSRTQYEVLRLFAAGHAERQIADETTLELRLVRRVVNDLCAGDRPTASDLVVAYEKRAAAVAAAQGKPPAATVHSTIDAPPPPAPAPPWSLPGSQMDLFKLAAASPHQRTRALGEKVKTLMDDLAARLTEEHEQAVEEQRRAEERAAAQQRLRELEQQLAQARAALKSTAAGRAPAAAPADAVSHKTVRAWAKAAGVECPQVGRVPQAVVDAYLERRRQVPRR